MKKANIESLKNKATVADKLMIGDWLLFYDEDECENIPVKIVSLDDDNWSFYEFPDGTRQDGWCSKLYPIPLTAEILEKNFKEFIPGINLMYELGGPYIVSDEDGKWVFGLISKEQSARYPLVKISYVHELQNALRLCGFDKEIEL